MKKIFLSLTMAAAVAMYAQPNLSVVLTSPSSGSNYQAGNPFTFGITINNTGSSGHLGSPSDTVIYFPLFNGQLLTGGGGTPVAWYMNDPIAAGGNVTRSQTLNISGGSSGILTVCAGIVNMGNSYATTQADTSDLCASVNYNATVSVGELRSTETFDNSFYSNGTYYVEVSSRVALINPTLDLVDISGRTVKHIVLTANDGNISQTVSLDELPRGIYLIRLQTDKGLISINKVVKQ